MKFDLGKVKIWLSQDRKELSTGNREYFSFSQMLPFRHTKQTSENVRDTTFKVASSAQVTAKVCLWAYLLKNFK